MIPLRRVTPRSVPYLGQIPSDLLFLDLETLPTEDPVIIKSLTDKVVPPGSMKKPETIAAWERDEKPALIAEAIQKTSFDGSYGSICCISWAFGDQPVQGSIGNEREILTDFFDSVQQYKQCKISELPNGTIAGSSELRVGGHNVRSFDLRFMWKRATILKVPKPVRLPWQSSSWDPRVQDTMSLWDPEKRISLGSLCYILGVEHEEDGFDGSMVAAAWKAGRHQQILRYCKADTEAARRCWWRLSI